MRQVSIFLEEILEDLSQDTYYPGQDWHPWHTKYRA